MDYNISEDIKAIREILSLTQSELATKLGVQQITISRCESGKTVASSKLLELVYNFAFENDIELGRLKEMLWKENIKKDHKLLFHGAKESFNGLISIDKSRANNDFGKGFYAGESYVQAISFVSAFEHSSVYYLDFDDDNLNFKKYSVDRDWMMIIAYYRGGLEAYINHPLLKRLINESREYDYIIAPIADNRMFQIINSFVYGEITDEQCKHCLAASNLGNQYVFISERSVKKLKPLERVYISNKEKEHYMNLKSKDAKLGEDKVKLARIKYRGKGKYIDEILK